jgi:signal transduction histidine kinase
LEIRISPPWWRSNWAYALYAVLLGLASWGILQWRTYSLRRQRQLLRTRVFEQTQELRKAKQTAEAANEAKSTFLSTVSHELRTPLTSIIGFTKLNKKNLEEKVLPEVNPKNPKAQKAAKRISKNLDVVSSEGQRLTALINELLDLAKIESGKVDWKMEELNPAELIERAVNATSALFTQKPALKLITEIPEDLPTITGDHDRLLQVLINLISNAVKFTDAGQVKIGAAITPPGAANSPLGGTQGGLTLSVADTGFGIPADQLDRVFERFQQVEDMQAGKPKGTGLGLLICKEIVEHHGGEIWVESEVGKGSVFGFSLPASLP